MAQIFTASEAGHKHLVEVVADAVVGSRTVNTVADLLALSAAPKELSWATLGYWSAGDGGHAKYRWNAASTATHDGGSVLKITAVTVGRFIMIVGPRIRVKTFGTIEDGVADDGAKIQAVIDFQKGVVDLTPGATYYATVAPVVKVGRVLKMHDATLNLTLGSGNVFGVRIGNKAGIQDGTINVNSTGTPSSQFIFHAPIGVGAPNNNGDSVASPDTYATVHDWFIKNMTLGTNRMHCPAIQVMGDSYNGVIDGIVIPDSIYCSGVHLDWGNVGVTSSSNIPGTKTAFLAGNAYTTHPHSIRITNISCGSLSVAQAADLSSHVVRLSACYGIVCENLRADKVTGSVFHHVGGDLGFEFAPAAIKPLAYRGIKVKGVFAKECTYQGIFVDTYADNIFNEIAISGYVPLTYTVYPSDIEVDGGIIVGSATSSDGVRLQESDGVIIKNVMATKFNYGASLEQKCTNNKIIGGEYYSNRFDGVYVENNSSTKHCEISDLRSWGNGTDATYASGIGSGIRVAGGDWITVRNTVVGAIGESVQDDGIYLESTATNCIVEENKIVEVKLGGFPFVFGSSADYGILWLFKGNRYSGSNATQQVAGANILPYERVPTLSTTVRAVGKFIADRANLSAGTTPTSGAWVRGDSISFIDQSTAASSGSVCSLGGSPGTWVSTALNL